MIARVFLQFFRSFSPLVVPAAIAACLLAGDTLLAKHPKNAGPTNFEIKFKLPPPPVLSPAQALQAFSIEPGFRIEVVAAEPLVEAPIAMSFDDQGRLYVCEMGGYMPDVEGTGEDQPIGRIKRLEDENGDGVMDKATIFVDKLVLPRAVIAIGGGALVAEPPELILYRDTNEDGVADHKQVIATDFGNRKGQPEHMANTPVWALDNWIYSAMHPTRFRYGSDKWATERDRGRGQWGMSQDDYGRLVFNSNSDLLRADVIPNAYFDRNPNFSGAAGLNLQVIKDQSVWPERPTPGVNRGYGDELREDGSLKKATAAGGAVIYRGDLFPEAYRGNAFIPEPAGNLVKRLIVAEKDGLLDGRNATPGTEFLTSTDERFRPVTAANGPDGALYLVDMYRGVLQHSGFLTHYLVANIKERQLEQPLDRGRIYRVLPENAKPRAVKLPQQAAQIVPLLAHANGWVRDTAQRVLVERADRSIASELEKMAGGDPSPLARLHTLWTLEGLGALTP
ncbi:MAG: dehydrogenase, partial [Verrucomicrobiota bacterium]|nr:dehydrogenase [Verrucomicrobiota bacterium]